MTKPELVSTEVHRYHATTLSDWTYANSKTSLPVGHCGNSKYWFRRAGKHPAFEPLQKAAAELADGQTDPAALFLTRQVEWDPFAFIDLCEQAEAGPPERALLCRKIQQREWQLLFDWCYRKALS